MQQFLSSNWFKRSLYFTVAAVLLTFVPFSPIAVAGGLALITILPGMQLTRWLGLYRQRWDFSTVTLSVALGMVTSPILIYWSSLLFGFSRGVLLVVFPVYIIILAGWLGRDGSTPESTGRDEPTSPDEPADSSRLGWVIAALLIGFTALGVFLAYFELETAQGFYPVQMEDWQKHYGVAFALRYTGIPPTSMFFYGMFPNETLIYYYFLHLNGATLDLLQSGGPFLHNAFVTTIVLASLSFGCVFFMLARTLFGSQKAALWSLAFATVIGGLDVIPSVHRAIQKYREHFPDGPIPLDVYLPREHIDNWVSALSLRLNTFYGYHIWVPQHLTGLTILCLGCYLYLKVRDRQKLLVILPLLLFALLGHSTWIAVIVFGCLFLFGLTQIFTLYRNQGLPAARALFFGYAAIAIAFFVIAAPFILPLIGPNAPKSGIAFEIPTLDSWSILRPFQANFGPTVWARLLDLPLHLFIEMGALLIAGLAGLILFWRDKTPSTTKQVQSPIQNPKSKTCTEFNRSIQNPKSLLPFWTLLLITGTLTVILFASGRGWAELGLIQNNDLGLRALMPGQLALALFAGYFMARLSAFAVPHWWKMILRGGMALLIGLGVAYAGWEFISMGLAKYSTEPQLSPAVYQILRTMPEVTGPQDKPFPVVQHRLHRDASRFQLSLGGRPIGFSTGEAVVFHRNVHDLALALELSRQAFDNGLPLWSYQMFHNLGANYIFVGPAEREAMRHPEKYQHPQYFRQVYRQGDFEIYQVHPLPYKTDQPPPLPYKTDQPQASFDEGTIEFEGYFLDTFPRYPGGQSAPSEESAGLVTAWRLTRSTDKNYTAFIHLVDADGNIIAQADHQLWAWDVKSEGPASIWTPNLTHLDIVPLPKEALATDASLTIRLGLWLPDTGQQFPVETSSLQVDEGGRVIVGQLHR